MNEEKSLVKNDKKEIIKINIKNQQAIIEIIATIFGAFIMATGIGLFLLPNQLSSGGVAGISTILFYLMKLPMGMTMLLINIPLFLVSIYKIGKNFFVKSIIGTVALSMFTDIFSKVEPLTMDKFLACIYGGILMGLRYSYNFEGQFFYWWN